MHLIMTTRTAVRFRSQTIQNRAIGPLVALALMRQVLQRRFHRLDFCDPGFQLANMF